MATQIILEGILQKSDPVNRNNGRIYDENTYKGLAKKYEIEMKMKNRKRKIENILSNLK
jgi:hypothetical protein